ncbi:hypothetical protein QBC45DRAFT_400133 [Copromyces sp. CBS 386.78]|nr:hypothetical protein QBC45DRAFT_400133 [Copromyces sp. CBS 386.78]
MQNISWIRRRIPIPRQHILRPNLLSDEKGAMTRGALTTPWDIHFLQGESRLFLPVLVKGSLPVSVQLLSCSFVFSHNYRILYIQPLLPIYLHRFEIANTHLRPDTLPNSKVFNAFINISPHIYSVLSTPSQDTTTERRNTTTREKEIMEAAASGSTSTEAGNRTMKSVETDTTTSTSTSTVAGTETSTKPTVSPGNRTSRHLAQDQRLTAQDEILTIMNKKRDVMMTESSNTDSKPSALSSASTSIAVGTTTQRKRKTTGEPARTEYSPGLLSSLDWFLKNKEKR